MPIRQAGTVADQCKARHTVLVLRICFEVQGILRNCNVRAICCPADAAIVQNSPPMGDGSGMHFQGTSSGVSPCRIRTLLGP